ncbi:biotin--[acetyl-CoA-carboxylase] ligase [Cryptosporangium phraense]|uniref:biotin--[biotin carboxyl-carrier protein] ligase n=1 Tax=Cryptosporangium phraense TaxID=2593070 RepID=A0A545AUJ3_9ACTN|nr:biotin--[acetyl-CoA-carboxylase] ligase [Cryptosporangium phraense]TQS44992.1 biotin--[acetyl-CoA-carboxylase] ligase [Cryptosporangium phraense]
MEQEALRARLLDDFWVALDVVPRTGSTNADLAEAARGGAPAGTVLVADVQDAGRGRIGRSWTSPPGAGLLFSVLFRPTDVPTERWGWLPLLAGVATARALPGVDARLKWPNDLLIGPQRKKAAGILAEAAGDAVVLGIGLNVTLGRDDLPPDRPDTTSLAIEGAPVTDRDELLVAILGALKDEYEFWRASNGDAAASGLLASYRERCDTLGREVRVEVPGGEPVQGRADDIDAEGRLVVGATHVAAGDVIHVRPA